MVHRAYRSVDLTRFMRLKVKATSFAVNASPSFHFTPERMVKSICVLAAFHL